MPSTPSSRRAMFGRPETGRAMLPCATTMHSAANIETLARSILAYRIRGHACCHRCNDELRR